MTSLNVAALNAIETAERNISRDAPMFSSASLCLKDAYALLAKGDYAYAVERARKSIAYSVGIFHPAYKGV